MENWKGSEWVKARFDCSVRSMFDRLREEVKCDVTARKELNPSIKGNRSFEFRFQSTGDTFVVSAERGESSRVAVFSVFEGTIVVLDQGDAVIVKGRVALSDDGVCRISVAGIEVETWQFRKRALEQLFFELP